jgi:hypothetical protein
MATDLLTENGLMALGTRHARRSRSRVFNDARLNALESVVYERNFLLDNSTANG